MLARSLVVTLGVRLLLCWSCLLPSADCRFVDTRLLRPQEPPVHGIVDVVRYAPGFERAKTEEDLEDLFRDNLQPDLAPFQHKRWNITAFVHFVKSFDATVPKHPLGDGNAAIVVIKGGTVQVAWLRGQDAHYRYECVRVAVEAARVLQFPDTAFVLNIDDFPVCSGERCPLPVFTMYKKWGPQGNLETNEVLLPVFNHHYEDIYNFPWERKRPKAMMRASFQGCMAPNASRVLLATASEANPASLDLGLTRLDGTYKHVLKRHVSKASFVTIEDHAKWKYLVSADGCVAQTRLAKVMLTNSVAIKEESPWIEYYYRSLKPWTHYAPFRPENADEDVLNVVERLRTNDAEAQHIAQTAQKWAYRYMAQYPRLLYFRRSLVEYNKLFGGDMERWVRGGGAERSLLEYFQPPTSETKAASTPKKRSKVLLGQGAKQQQQQQQQPQQLQQQRRHGTKRLMERGVAPAAGVPERRRAAAVKGAKTPLKGPKAPMQRPGGSATGLTLPGTAGKATAVGPRSKRPSGGNAKAPGKQRPAAKHKAQ